MRIRHTTSNHQAESVNDRPMDRLTMPNADTSTITQNHVNQRFSKSDGYVSPSSVMTEYNEDPNGIYLKPDFLDPLNTSKCDSICPSPSPLAMLAKTCQNIGQMMESKSSLNMATECVRNGTHITSSARQPVMTALCKSTKLKTDSRQLNVPKRVSNVPSRTKWNKSELLPSETTEQPHCSSKIPSPTADSSYHSATSPIESIHYQHRCGLAETKTSSSSSSVSLAFQQSTTSNALAQLARLSSSLALPEPSKATDQSFSDPVGRSGWGGGKRSHGLGPASGDLPRKFSRDSAFYEANGNTTSMSHSPDNMNRNSAAQLDTESHSQSSFWFGLLGYMQQLMEQKESQTRPQAQDVSAYNLAHSFLDYFYAKLTNSKSDSSLVLPPPPVLSSSMSPPIVTAGRPAYPNNSSVFASQDNSTTPTRCLFCTYQCSSPSELYYHAYQHLATLCKDQMPTPGTNSTHGTCWPYTTNPMHRPIPHANLMETVIKPATLEPKLNNVFDEACPGRNKSAFIGDTSLITADSLAGSYSMEKLFPDRNMQAAYWMRLLNSYWSSLAPLSRDSIQSIPVSSVTSTAQLLVPPPSTGQISSWPQVLFPGYNSTNPYMSLFPQV